MTRDADSSLPEFQVETELGIPIWEQAAFLCDKFGFKRDGEPQHLIAVALRRAYDAGRAAGQAERKS